jgi:hypothetical protein
MNPSTLPAGVDSDDVRARMAAGLTQDQAVEAIVNQKDHDKRKPHDKPPKESSDAGAAAIGEMTVEELKNLAADKGIEITSHMTKADLIKAIKAAA